MSSFFQDGVITTIHALYDPHGLEEYLELLEHRLEEYSNIYGISLLLPCRYAEIQDHMVLDRIIDEVRKVKYLGSVIIALGDMEDVRQFKEAKEYFGLLKTPKREVKVIWVDGPKIQNVLNVLKTKGLNTGVRGKGQSVWIGLGYLLGQKKTDVIVLHDCDIVTYDRILLGRLIEPITNPNKGFEFCKGYYARISPTQRVMKGRVTRLFVFPFIDAMKDVMHAYGKKELERFFSFHQSFYYPLSGEICFLSKLASALNITYDWSLEVSTLSEVYNRVITRNVAQVELTHNYEHKHQDLSPEDKGKGLHRMVVDIAKFYFFYMRSHGMSLDNALIDMIRNTYYQNSLKFIKRYSDDAESNGLVFDRYQEELSARYFRDFVAEAWEESQEQSEGFLIPSWARVHFSVPGIYTNLVKAVEEENE